MSGPSPGLGFVTTVILNGWPTNTRPGRPSINSFMDSQAKPPAATRLLEILKNLLQPLQFELVQAQIENLLAQLWQAQSTATAAQVVCEGLAQRLQQQQLEASKTDARLQRLSRSNQRLMEEVRWQMGDRCCHRPGTCPAQMDPLLCPRCQSLAVPPAGPGLPVSPSASPAADDATATEGPASSASGPIPAPPGPSAPSTANGAVPGPVPASTVLPGSLTRFRRFHALPLPPPCSPTDFT